MRFIASLLPTFQVATREPRNLENLVPLLLRWNDFQRVVKELSLSKIIIPILIVILFLSINVHAQEEISQKRSPNQESGEQETTAARDTTELIPVESNLYWYDIQNNLSLKSDSSTYEIHRLADEKLSYIWI